MTKTKKPLEVLVADDESNVTLLIKRIGAMEGENITTANGGQECIDQYGNATIPYDGVITDLKMPGKSGIDVIKYVKGDSPKTPVVVITGEEPNNEYKNLKAQLGELSPDAVIHKPFTAQTIASIFNYMRGVRDNPENPPIYQLPTT